MYPLSCATVKFSCFKSLSLYERQCFHWLLKGALWPKLNVSLVNLPTLWLYRLSPVKGMIQLHWIFQFAPKMCSCSIVRHPFPAVDVTYLAGC